MNKHLSNFKNSKKYSHATIKRFRHMDQRLSTNKVIIITFVKHITNQEGPTKKPLLRYSGNRLSSLYKK